MTKPPIAAAAGFRDTVRRIYLPVAKLSLGLVGRIDAAASALRARAERSVKRPSPSGR